MKFKNLAITGGLALALTGALYLGSGAQAGSCNIGGEIGPGVPVVLAAQQTDTQPPQPAADKQEQKKDQPAPAKPADQSKAQKPAQPQGTGVPQVPIIAPDEGC